MGRQREKTVCLRLSGEEFRILKQLARRRGVSASDVLRLGIRLQSSIDKRLGSAPALHLLEAAATGRTGTGEEKDVTP